MEIKEIIESGFFKSLLSDYVDYYVSYHYGDHDRLIYALCNSDEEKDIATREEIGVIKKKIRELGHEEMSFDFLMRYQSKNPNAYSEQVNDPSYWENHFYELFINEISEVKSLTPFTDAQSKIVKLPEDPSPKDIDEDTLDALFWVNDQTQNIPFMAECEEAIMDQIEADIEGFTENDYWEIEVDFYEEYIEQSEVLKQLFNLCELLVQLFRLRMFESFLGLKSEVQNYNPLKDKLEEYGFFNLPMVKQIPVEKQSSLIDFIRSNKIPYTIAFLDYLGFLRHLEKEHFPTKYKLNLELSKWLNSNERAIKGNISSLLPNSTEDKNRYTAYRHKELVEKDYQRLK